MGLSEAVAFFYKVKYWKLDVDFPGWTINAQTITQTNHEDERQLSCSVLPVSINLNATKVVTVDNGFGVTVEYTRVISSDLTWSLGNQVPVFIDDQYAIKFFEISNGVQLMQKTDYLTFKATATAGGYYNKPDAVPAPTDSAGFFTISPSEYWTYDPGDGGGPIYDSTTGAQLRAFPAN